MVNNLRIILGDAWVWLAFAPTWRLVVAFAVGKRNQQNADLLLERLLHCNHHPHLC